MEIIQGLGIFTIIIALIIIAIPITVIVTILSRLKLIGKNTAIIADNQVEMERKNAERHAQMMNAIMQQNNLIETQNRMLAHLINEKRNNSGT